MPSLLYKELKKTKKPTTSQSFQSSDLSVSACVFILVISNMNGVDVKKPLVTKLFCYVVILKEAVSPKLRVKL